MSKKEVRANMGLLPTAAIWGFAFVAQRVGAQYIGAFTFNGIRFLLGAVSLLLLVYVIRKKGQIQLEAKTLMKGGVIAGIILFAASALQQIGMSTTTAGKGGFITGLHIVLVPVFGLFLKQKTGRNTWIGIAFAVVGLYLLSIKEGFRMERGDVF
ncbi:MAG: DMT family transporter [Lachnospiraceae bacterium]|nr:DMT family transporter [Lachnospiraceae bacterium]